jgi:hypothetical protein
VAATLAAAGVPHTAVTDTAATTRATAAPRTATAATAALRQGGGRGEQHRQHDQQGIAKTHDGLLLWVNELQAAALGRNIDVTPRGEHGAGYMLPISPQKTYVAASLADLWPLIT